MERRKPLSRRDFLKLAGGTAGGLALQACGVPLTPETSASSQSGGFSAEFLPITPAGGASQPEQLSTRAPAHAQPEIKSTASVVFQPQPEGAIVTSRGLRPEVVAFIDEHHNKDYIIDMTNYGTVRYYKKPVGNGEMHYFLVVLDENVLFKNVGADGMIPWTNEADNNNTVWLNSKTGNMEDGRNGQGHLARVEQMVYADYAQVPGYKLVAATNADFFGAITSPEGFSPPGHLNSGRAGVCVLPDMSMLIDLFDAEEAKQCNAGVGGGFKFFENGRIAGYNGEPPNPKNEDFQLWERRWQAHTSGEPKTAFAYGRTPVGVKMAELIITYGLDGQTLGQVLDAQKMQHGMWFDSDTSTQGMFLGDKDAYPVRLNNIQPVSNMWAVYAKE